MALHENFNQTSDKIVSVEEFLVSVEKQLGRDGMPFGTDDRQITRDIITDMSEWEDGAGLGYFSEIKLKRTFSNLSSAVKNTEIQETLSRTINGMQKTLDLVEDHRGRIESGSLRRVQSFG